ncbi:MAG: hypothetical protein ACRC33_16385 [Gemmataceae bacterium]
MIIDLHPDLERFVRELARSGEYRDEAEVLADALFLLWQSGTPEDANVPK